MKKQLKASIIDFVKSKISFTAFVIIFLLFFILLGFRFLNLSNIQTILEQTVVVLVVSVGLTFVIMMGSIDLSVGSTVGLCGVISADILHMTGSTPLAIVGGLIVGALVGLFNGVVHIKLKIPSFITTLGTLSIVRAVAIIYSNGSIVMIPFESGFKKMGLTPWILLIGAFIFVIIYILQKMTVFGRYTKMIGGDENVAILSGIKVPKYKVLNFILGGALAGMGGMILAAKIGSGSPASGQGFEMDTISAVVLGGTTLTGGVGGIGGTLIGALILSILANGLVLLGMPSEVQMLVKGLVLILAVFLSLERDKIGIIK